MKVWVVLRIDYDDCSLAGAFSTEFMAYWLTIVSACAEVEERGYSRHEWEVISTTVDQPPAQPIYEEPTR